MLARGRPTSGRPPRSLIYNTKRCLSLRPPHSASDARPLNISVRATFFSRKADYSPPGHERGLNGTTSLVYIRDPFFKRQLLVIDTLSAIDIDSSSIKIGVCDPYEVRLKKLAAYSSIDGKSNAFLTNSDENEKRCRYGNVTSTSNVISRDSFEKRIQPTLV